MGRPFSQFDEKQVFDLYEKGHSIEYLSRKFNLTFEKIRYRMHARGVRVRPSGGTADGVAVVNSMFTIYRRHAKSIKCAWELTKDQFTALTIQDCHYCGAPPSVRSYFIGKPFRVNGVDRKCPAQGYTSENCLPCCAQCNMAKGNMGYEEFKTWIWRVAKYLLEAR